MDSISPYTTLPSRSELTSKQQNCLNALDLAVSKTGIEIHVNPKGKSYTGPTSLDVEHDEYGGFVGCGLYNGVGSVDYYSDPLRLHSVDFHSLAIIAHNGVSDIDVLSSWGINVSNEQLYWDSMLLGHILDSSLKSYSLKDMAKRELGIEYPSYDDIVGKRGLKAERITLDKQPLELVSMYNSLDVYCTYKLYERQKNVAL